MMIRVYEFSKKIDIPSKDLVKLLQDNGFDVSTHMSVLTDDAIKFLNEKFLKKHPSPEASKPQHAVGQKTVSHPLHIPKKEQPAATVKKELTRVPMTVAQFCEITNLAVSDVIVHLLKKGIAAPKNFVLSEKQIDDLARDYVLEVVEPSRVQEDAPSHRAGGGTGERRAPIVVIVGHVDHGKTTLLDYIRKTRVAEREKGGITQHLGAYEVRVQDEPLVFLDTPGHEAFSLIRVRGIKVADIAILVVAADDGVMPQTIESISRLKASEIPIIVALNKIDKASQSQIEATKRGLSQHGLVPEEWGGQTTIVPLSAKLGMGVSDLLDMIVLQSQMMDLAADATAPAKGFVLESKMEKGRGPVATVICHQGTLRVGDFFATGSTSGKVTSIVDSYGKSLREIKPSFPAQISGFEELPAAGSVFQVMSAQQIKEWLQNESVQPVDMSHKLLQEGAIPLIIRADNMSSKEALLNAIAKVSQKAYQPFHVVRSGIGIITENDIELAADTKALVYGFHAKIEKDAQVLAHKLGVSYKLFDVIYKLLEELEGLAEKGRPIKKVWKKIGQAVVLKVFDIKGLGVIAGCQVKSGKFVKEGKVVVHRGKYKVGDGMIKSLQRDKKSVKEVLAGFECAFMIDGFNDWIVDDVVDCFAELPE